MKKGFKGAGYYVETHALKKTKGKDKKSQSVFMMNCPLPFYNIGYVFFRD